MMHTFYAHLKTFRSKHNTISKMNSRKVSYEKSLDSYLGESAKKLREESLKAFEDSLTAYDTTVPVIQKAL